MSPGSYTFAPTLSWLADEFPRAAGIQIRSVVKATASRLHLSTILFSAVKTKAASCNRATVAERDSAAPAMEQHNLQLGWLKLVTSFQ